MKHPLPHALPNSRPLYTIDAKQRKSNADRTLTARVLVWVAVPAHKNLHTAAPTGDVLIEAKLLFEWEPIKRALTDVIIGERKVEAYARDPQTGLGVGVGIARNTRIRHVRHPFVKWLCSSSLSRSNSAWLRS